MKILWIFLGVKTKLDYNKRSFLSILGSFLKVKLQNGEYFWGCYSFKYLFGVLEIPDNFFVLGGGGGGGGGGVNRRCWA